MSRGIMATSLVLRLQRQLELEKIETEIRDGIRTATGLPVVLPPDEPANPTGNEPRCALKAKCPEQLEEGGDV